MKKENILKILEEADKTSSNLTDKQLIRNQELLSSGHYYRLGKLGSSYQMENNLGIHTDNQTLRREWASKGGKVGVHKMNDKNKESGHWRNLGDSKIGISRSDETKSKIQKGTSHSWREVSQVSKDGVWIRDWDNFADIQRECDFNKAPIWKVCNNKKYCKTAYGFIWKYK